MKSTNGGAGLPACSPLNISARFPKYCESPTIKEMMVAMEGMGTTWGAILDARDKNDRNPLRTSMANKKATYDYAWQAVQPYLKAADRLSAAGTAEAERLEQAILKPLRDTAKSPLAAEARRHVKALRDEDRSEFLHVAIRNGDDFTVAAALGAPYYLSGLNESAAAVLLQNWQRSRHAETTEHIAALRGASEFIMAAGSTLLNAVTKLVDVEEIRAAVERAKEAEAASHRVA
jgi:hypothetical protein